MACSIAVCTAVGVGVCGAVAGARPFGTTGATGSLVLIPRGARRPNLATIAPALLTAVPLGAPARVTGPYCLATGIKVTGFVGSNGIV